MKGILFSFDAIMALSIIILLFATIQIASEGNEGRTEVTLYTKSADNAQIRFYKDNYGVNGIDNPTVSDKVNCKSIFSYDMPNATNAVIVEKVRKCQQLGG